MMNHEPNVFENIRAELSDIRSWGDRAIVLGYAVLAGLCVVGFTMASDWSFEHFRSLERSYPWAVLIWTPTATALIADATRRWFPGATGSGIPQIKAAIDPDLPADHGGWFASLRLSAGKILLGTAGFAAGLSVGREGPSVQVAAGVMQQAAARKPASRTASGPCGGCAVVRGGATRRSTDSPYRILSAG